MQIFSVSVYTHLTCAAAIENPQPEPDPDPETEERESGRYH